jgi:hypothetical protein
LPRLGEPLGRSPRRSSVGGGHPKAGDDQGDECCGER